MDYSNAQGYGFWCGRKCVAKKQAQGIAPKRSGKGGKHDAAWQELQNEKMRVAAASAGGNQDAGGGSKAPLVIGVVVLLGIVATIVIVKMKK
jgi:hypothetical protein